MIHNQMPLRWMPVLMYHRVVDEVRAPNQFNMQISAADFDAQMCHLRARGYQAIRLEDVPAAVSDRSPWRKPIAISFDDGYQDTYTHAFPILEKYGLVATIMLVSECIGGRNTWDFGKAESAPLLSLREIRELEMSGMSFGAHGTIHLSLADVDADTARRELAESKATLEGILGREISTFAFPYGHSTPDVCRIAQEAGYVAAFGVDQTTHSLFNFSRIDAAAFRGNTHRWQLKVAGTYHAVRKYTGVKVPNNFREGCRKHSARLWARLTKGTTVAKDAPAGDGPAFRKS
jgi:peptidoglycan/xylan/chitin deacetylase (PgdA/CDA1 family)